MRSVKSLDIIQTALQGTHHACSNSTMRYAVPLTHSGPPCQTQARQHSLADCDPLIHVPSNVPEKGSQVDHRALEILLPQWRLAAAPACQPRHTLP